MPAKSKVKGTRNRRLGYFYRKGRGWTTKIGGRMVALKDEFGETIRSKDASHESLVQAYNRHLALETEGTNVAGDDLTVADVCRVYMVHCESESADETVRLRGGTLFDFCTGLPSSFRERIIAEEDIPKAEIEGARLHPGFGQIQIKDLKPLHLTQWLDAHPSWNGSKRTQINGIMSAMNYAAGDNMKLISANPLAGYKKPQWNRRPTYLSPEQEQAFRQHGDWQFNDALSILIRSGMRYGIEFCMIRPHHVKRVKEGLEVHFQPFESKTKRLRIIRIPSGEKIAQEVIRLFDRALDDYQGEGCIFRDKKDRGWTRHSFNNEFNRVKAKVKKAGVELDKHCRPYSTRHTYAKRVLQGFWTGKATNIETLAKLMGNSPKTCLEYYAEFVDSYTKPLWDAS